MLGESPLHAGIRFSSICKKPFYFSTGGCVTFFQLQHLQHSFFPQSSCDFQLPFILSTCLPDIMIFPLQWEKQLSRLLHDVLFVCNTSISKKSFKSISVVSELLSRCHSPSNYSDIISYVPVVYVVWWLAKIANSWGWLSWKLFHSIISFGISRSKFLLVAAEW